MSRYVLLATAINTEKARSEWIIAPLLAELKFQFKDQVSLFSGIEFNLDPSDGLKGRCDFIISKSGTQLSLTAPVMMLVEAKNENLIAGIPPCVAEMIAAQRFNERKGRPLPALYGAVTTGSLWLFLKLEGQQVFADGTEYSIQSAEKILGILKAIALS